MNSMFAVFLSRSALLVATSLLGSPPVCAAATGLQAGVAKVDITPTQPVRLAGYQSRTNLSEGVHDPLSARATAFRSGDRRLVLVSTDVLGFYGGSAEVIRQAILSECQLQPGELFLSAIHTHSAPTVTLDLERGHSNNVVYSKTLQGKLVDVVQQSLADLRPAQLTFASGAAPVGSNRRQKVVDQSGASRIVLGRNPEAPIDREVQVLKLALGDTDKPAAVLFAFATHSTSLGPRNYQISGDVHGLAEQFIEGFFESKVTAAGFAGASGDIDPWFRVLPGFNTTRNWIPEPVLLGTFLGEEVVHVLDQPQTSSGDAGLSSLFRTIELPGKTSAPVSLNITAARVGDVAFVGLGGEVFNHIGRAIKAASPFRCTVIITHCNGTAGYLPTPDVFDEGGYEVQSSRFGPQASEQVIAKTVEMLNQIRSPD